MNLRRTIEGNKAKPTKNHTVKNEQTAAKNYYNSTGELGN